MMDGILDYKKPENIKRQKNFTDNLILLFIIVFCIGAVARTLRPDASYAGIHFEILGSYLILVVLSIYALRNAFVDLSNKSNSTLKVKSIFVLKIIIIWIGNIIGWVALNGEFDRTSIMGIQITIVWLVVVSMIGLIILKIFRKK